jgi:hypothetical protein
MNEKKTVAEWLADPVEPVDGNDDFGVVMNKAIAELPHGSCDSNSPRVAAGLAWERVDQMCDPDGYDPEDLTSVGRAFDKLGLYLNIAKFLDALVGGFGFIAGIAYAIDGQWDKATFFMVLATNCELGYWMARRAVA